MERTYDIPVLERTTAEVQASLKQAAIERDIKRQFTDFLDESDLVKFAKFTPDIPSAYRLLAAGVEIVERTKPVPAPSGSGGAASPSDTVAEMAHHTPSGPQATASQVKHHSEVTP
jgi:hypothetical protein